MMLYSTTKMAYQAATAIAIAECLAWFFHFDRGYWITLTAMALTMQTWGESIKRALERISMTLLGGLMGTGLYFIVPHHPHVILALLLFFVFVTIFTLQIFYLISVFSLTCFVVFLFALIGEWNMVILWDRILETLLGAIIALLVGAVLFPIKIDIWTKFIEFWEHIDACIDKVLECSQDNHALSHHLATEAESLKKAAQIARYQLLFHRISQHEFFKLLQETSLAAQYMVNFIEASEWVMPHVSTEDQQAIREVVAITHHNIKMLIQAFKVRTVGTMLAVTRASDLLDRAIETNPQRFAQMDHEALGFFNLMYFLARLNTCLIEVHKIMNLARQGRPLE